MSSGFPARYEKIAVLGKGGGGQVWSVRDRLTNKTVALKALAGGFSESDAQALVREATALSGLEGLGVTRVLRFGRLPDRKRPYMVRELVKGRSLAALIEPSRPDCSACLQAVARAADQLTRLHRTGLLHGDVKPANIIVTPTGAAKLVDLGLAAPWREGGTPPKGLTPQYAAPELFSGKPLTMRAEIYALGATLSEVLDRCRTTLSAKRLRELRRVAQRAMDAEPANRFPSADELASALRHGAGIGSADDEVPVDASWPVVGVDAVANRLLSEIATLPRGSLIAMDGKTGSGRTTLLRRAAWSLGVGGRDVAWVESQGSLPWIDALEIELSACDRDDGVVILIDDAEHLAEAVVQRITKARAAGARIVLVCSVAAASAIGEPVERFVIPPLDQEAAADLVRRVIPSLSDTLVKHVIARSDGRPGRLRSIVRSIGRHAVVSPADVDHLLESGSDARTPTSARAGAEHVELLLDQGRFEEAAKALARVKKSNVVSLGLARSRLALGQGEAREAMAVLREIQSKALKGPLSVRRRWMLQAARVHLRLGAYAESAACARKVVAECKGSADANSEAISLEARACLGLVRSYSGEHGEAERILRAAAERARQWGDRRVEAIVLGSLAIALQRADKLSEARQAYEGALEAAEAAGDAGAVANTRLNLAVVTKAEGDLAQAIQHLEAAVDMGRRAGRGSTTRQALLNLANLDIYLGRQAHARSSIAALVEQGDQLAPDQQAQLDGLRAELAACTDDIASAIALYDRSASEYEALGRNIDAAEARLEGVLTATRAQGADPVGLARVIERAMEALGDSTAHRALLALARGAVAMLQNNEERARAALDEALTVSRASGQKEWVWRALLARSRLFYEMGQALAARHDSEEALAVLEEIASRLPRDLREVYWNDPRRGAVRTSLVGSVASPKAQSVPLDAPAAYVDPALVRITRGGPSTTLAALPPEERLARLLEINRELAREHDRERLLERVTDYAILLLNAERGFVILRIDDELVVHTSRDRKGEDPHAQFSRNIAQRVVASGEPMVTLRAASDERVADYLSVHQLNVQSVACVPIRSPDGRVVGALYLETRLRPGLLFQRELPTLLAFADQVAIAIESARLVAENVRRANELASANAELTRAHKRLEEILGHRTAQLQSTRRDLRSTRAVLQSHFGYHGLVGTSAKMRRVYALVDRIRETDVPVLITGESGTGKEIVARAIHSAGPRAKHAFTGVNCSAIPEHLLESELFGHVRGAFTGADRDRKGLFRETEGGTILLDEIGEMPNKMQAGLLRVLQEHVVRPVGSAREEPVSVRVIAATHRDLRQMVEQKAFREDLYYRLNVMEVPLPPLRERAGDIPILIDHFLQIFAARYRRDRKTIARDALRYLCSYSWPGNVRQLENALLNAWVMSDRSELSIEDFESLDIKASVPTTSRPSSERARSSGGSEPIESVARSHRGSEKDRILAALSSCNSNRVRAAALLGMPRRTFYRRLKKHDLQ